ncbi:MAG: hypothetical protein U9Q66_02840 [Patescibacteria group bacterium]|nr:hypothetical protein [Patescibacteria group bacterium]
MNLNENVNNIKSSVLFHQDISKIKEDIKNNFYNFFEEEKFIENQYCELEDYKINLLCSHTTRLK